jgi:uncharacterized paraquat-inducible protein A
MQCDDCKTVAGHDDPYCGACGGHLRVRTQPLPYDFISALFTLGIVLLYWMAQA